MAQDFLVEIGTEELPPKALKQLSQAFTQGIVDGLNAVELSHGSVKSYAAPRRLAVFIEALEEQTPLKEVEVWGPPAKIAFDADGNPTKAAEAFAKKNGIAVTDLNAESDGKVEKLVHRAQAGGEAAVEKFESIVQTSLDKLPIPKRMRWGARRTEFVRPVHWIVMLFGREVVDATIMGLRANRETRGHRFHYNQTIFLDAPAEYAEKLKNPGYVIVDFDERQTLVQEQVEEEGKKAGGEAVIGSDLLNEVTALVEWPVALTGNFEERFLDVPAEALISSMKEHQKYFHVVDANHQLLPKFITVSNIESTDPSQVIDGNERVIRPRLSDAAFFFETDKKSTLEQQRERLKNIVFQAQLGTVFEKTERVAKLAASIATKLNADASKAERAGVLCKSDLITDMVGEFDKMQGIAGYYYAINDGEDEEVAKALNEQYLPRFAGDTLPETTTGSVIALADRLDTLSGIFGIGQKPSGSKDPFALRRASLAVLRLLVEKDFNLDLRELLTEAASLHNKLTDDNVVDNALNYMLERFRAWYEDENISPEIFMAVAAKNLSEPLDINKRVHAVSQFSQLPEAQALAAANKRVSNILEKNGGDSTSTVNPDLLQENAEKALALQVSDKTQQVAPLFQARNYAEALSTLASLREVVDAFFDEVMVMADDEALRNNRIALLSQLRNLFLEVADISLLVPAK